MFTFLLLSNTFYNWKIFFLFFSRVYYLKNFFRGDVDKTRFSV